MDWFKRLQDHVLVAASAPVHKRRGAREALFALWSAARCIPENELDHYSFLTEDQIEDTATSLALDAVFAPVPDSAADDIKSLVLEMAARLRAAERLYISMEHPSAIRRPAEFLARSGEDEGYVLPR